MERALLIKLSPTHHPVREHLSVPQRMVPPGYNGSARDRTLGEAYSTRILEGAVPLSDLLIVTVPTTSIRESYTLTEVALWGRFGLDVEVMEGWSAAIRNAIPSNQLVHATFSAEVYLALRMGMTPSLYAATFTRCGEYGGVRAELSWNHVRQVARVAAAIRATGVSVSDSEILSWYIQEWEPSQVAELVRVGATPSTAGAVRGAGVYEMQLLLKVLTGQLPLEWARAYCADATA